MEAVKERTKVKVSLLPHTSFLKDDGTFDREEALLYSARVGGICYNQDGLMASFSEPLLNTEKRVKITTSGEHQSIYEHINVGLYFEDIPKILIMILNNEHQYSTSERSLRYTPIKYGAAAISDKEIDLYFKWMEILKTEIKSRYSSYYTDSKIETIAQENSRFMITMFINSEMVHTIPLAQVNRVAVFLKKYIEEEPESKFKERIVPYMEDVLSELVRLNVIDDRLQSNRKNRTISLFGKNLKEKKEEFGEAYSTVYKGTCIELAQAQRHRTLYYQIEFDEDNKEYFVPPIIEGNKELREEWLNDLNSVKDLFPLGELMLVHEKGTYDTFKMKLKERLCTACQVEVMRLTKETLDKYLVALKKEKHPLYNDLIKYSKGARCTFPDYKCSRPCNFPEGINLTRLI